MSVVNIEMKGGGYGGWYGGWYGGYGGNDCG